MDAVYDILDKLFDVARTFGPHEWALVSVVTLMIGYMCLRGMNIR